MKKRIILDVDGTLIPTPDYKIAIQSSFDDLGIFYTENDVTNFIKAMSSYEDKHESYNYDEYLKYVRYFLGKNMDKSVLDNYFKHTERLIPQKPDLIILETLEYLMGKHYELGVLSNFFKEVQEGRLNDLGYLKYFSFVLGGEEFMKPDRRAYYQAASGMQPENVVFIGDSVTYDFEIPKSMGFDAILYDPNYQYSTKTLVNSFSDIRKVL